MNLVSASDKGILEESARQVWGWAKSQSFAGNDPHDWLSSPLFARISNPTIRLVLLQLGRRSALNCRALLRVPKRENAKANALFLMGLVAAGDGLIADAQQIANSLAERLIAMQNSDGGWGYPFGWQSRTHWIPAGGSNIVTTSFCGMALCQWITKAHGEAREAVERAAQFVLEDVPRLETDNGVAFGYAPNDPQIVFNASLLGGELLAQVGSLFGNVSYQDTARAVAGYTVHHQRDDGGWWYGQEASQQWEDSFHTGYVIESLRTIGRVADYSEALTAAARGMAYYRENFLEADGAVRYWVGKRYPIDAHAVGQALSLFAHAGDFPSAMRVARFATEYLQDKRGYFYYQQHRHFTNRIAYLRWSNAWMFKGLMDVLAG